MIERAAPSRPHVPLRAAGRLRHVLDLVRRARQKPPRYLARRLLSEAHVEAGRLTVWLRDRRFGVAELLTATETSTLDELWSTLAARPYVATTTMASGDYDAVCPGDAERIRARAQAAVDHRVTLLGGEAALGSDIDWSRDFKTGDRWPHGFGLRLQYNQPDRPSDVKVPWELSRLQWLIPLGQAYALDGDERWAEAARDILAHWIAANPYGYTVNWAVTMEVALRIVCWTWLFHAFKHARAWRDDRFRADFLRSLFLHGEFTERYIERSDVNGNHFTADAAGLVFAGLFFGRGAVSRRWHDAGWQALRDELPYAGRDARSREQSMARARPDLRPCAPAHVRRRLGDGGRAVRGDAGNEVVGHRV